MNATTFFRSSLLLLLLISLTTCQGQEKKPVSRKVTVTKQTARQDFDPYFSPSTTSSPKQGPKSITRNIIQTRSGDIWLATWEGIIRYDGASFTNFTNQKSLRKYHVFSALEDRDGNLWFGTIGAGIYRYDGKSFTNITKEDGLAGDQLGCFFQDRSGKIWIGTLGGGISIYDGTSYRNLSTDNGLLSNDINSILEDRSGKIWIAAGTLFTYDGETFTQIQKDNHQLIPSLANKEAKAFYNVRQVIEDRKGNIWFGGNDGLWRYGTDGRFVQFDKQFTGYILEDRAGNIWTSAEAGENQEWRISRYAADDLEGDTASPAIILQQQNMFFGITEDSEGGIWVGSLRGVGRYDGTAFDWFREE